MDKNILKTIIGIRWEDRDSFLEEVYKTSKYVKTLESWDVSTGYIYKNVFHLEFNNILMEVIVSNELSSDFDNFKRHVYRILNGIHKNKPWGGEWSFTSMEEDINENTQLNI